jgi:hypothetical protein
MLFAYIPKSCEMKKSKNNFFRPIVDLNRNEEKNKPMILLIFKMTSVYIKR